MDGHGLETIIVSLEKQIGGIEGGPGRGGGGFFLHSVSITPHGGGNIAH